ncbi:MAG TPA: hypothetical protein PKD70_06265 [Saprospiraceae bacterium]|nr:hypothetical protein [Saprospiraceae bacterium]HMP13462.1 hypothetical protein [Saprospiraceae bacterium]
MSRKIFADKEYRTQTGLIEQGEFTYPAVTENFRVNCTARSIKFLNTGTKTAFVNGEPVPPNFGVKVVSASPEGILIQDFLIQFPVGTGTQEVYVTEVRDYGQATNF